MTSRSYVRVVVELELLPPSRSVGEDIAAAGPWLAAAGGEVGSWESDVHCLILS